MDKSWTSVESPAKHRFLPKSRLQIEKNEWGEGQGKVLSKAVIIKNKKSNFLRINEKLIHIWYKITLPYKYFRRGILRNKKIKLRTYINCSAHHKP